MSNSIKEQALTIIKEINKDALRKYVMLSEDMFKKHNVTNTKNVKGYLELKTVDIPNEKTETMINQISEATVLLVVDDFTVSIRLF